MYPEPVVSSTIRSLFIDGPAGRLEALLNAGRERPTHAALVCHPHPVYGGTMHNKVVFHAMKALNSFGFPVLRFNFRGVTMRGRANKTMSVPLSIGSIASFTCRSSLLAFLSAPRSACSLPARMTG